MMRTIIVVLIISGLSCVLQANDVDKHSLLIFKSNTGLYEYPDSNLIMELSLMDSLMWVKNSKDDYYGIGIDYKSDYWIKVKFGEILGWVKFNDITIDYELYRYKDKLAYVDYIHSDGQRAHARIKILNNDLHILYESEFLMDYKNAAWINKDLICLSSDYRFYVFDIRENWVDTIVGESPILDTINNKIIFSHNTWFDKDSSNSSIYALDFNTSKCNQIFTIKEPDSFIQGEGGEGYISPEIVIENYNNKTYYTFTISKTIDKKTHYYRYKIDSNGRFVEKEFYF